MTSQMADDQNMVGQVEYTSESCSLFPGSHPKHIQKYNIWDLHYCSNIFVFNQHLNQGIYAGIVTLCNTDNILVWKTSALYYYMQDQTICQQFVLGVYLIMEVIKFPIQYNNDAKVM
jgi:hypothetical protein